jgi:DNA-directed RNA polymerase specialized sigma24 family protein
MSKSESASQLDKTLRLLALVALEGKKQKEQIQLLDKAGFGQSEIAAVLGSTPKAISVRLAEIRRDTRDKSNNKSK